MQNESYLILTADWHFTFLKDPQDKFLSQKRSLGERFFALLEKGNNKFEKIISSSKDYYLVKKFIESHPKAYFNLLIDGDWMQGRFNERGWLSEEEVTNAKILLENLADFWHTPLARIRLNAGNHELGFRSFYYTDKEAGISKQSIHRFLETARREYLYESFKFGRWRVVLMPYLFMESRSRDLALESVKRQILEDFWEDLEKEEDIVLVLHDPGALCYNDFYQILKARKRKIKKVFCGHYHSQRAFDLTRKMIDEVNEKRRFKWRFWWYSRFLKTFFGEDVAWHIERNLRDRRKLPNLAKEFQIKLIEKGKPLILDEETLEEVSYLPKANVS